MLTINVISGCIITFGGETERKDEWTIEKRATDCIAGGRTKDSHGRDRKGRASKRTRNPSS